MQQSITFIWPRAERAIYDGPKNLAAHAAKARRSQRATARAPSSPHRQGPTGAAWLEQPSAPRVRSEAMVRATYAEYDDKDALLRTISSLREHAGQLHAGGEAVTTSYLEDRAAFPERAHMVALNVRFILDYIPKAQAP